MFTLAFSVSVFAQNKMLSSKQLMTGNLYPRSTMRGVQFVGTTNQIAYIQDTVLYMGQPGKAKSCLTLSQLNKVLQSAGIDALSYMPSIKAINGKEISFNAAGKVLSIATVPPTLSTTTFTYMTKAASFLSNLPTKTSSMANLSIVTSSVSRRALSGRLRAICWRFTVWTSRWSPTTPWSTPLPA